MSGGTYEGLEERLENARHDLWNVVLALRAGLSLVEARLDAGDGSGARAVLAEMRDELRRADPSIEAIRVRSPQED